MKPGLKLHFAGVAIFIFLGAYKLAKGEGGYEVPFMFALGAMGVGLIMKLYDDYVETRRKNNI